jgi:cell division septal protein FtsQ
VHVNPTRVRRLPRSRQPVNRAADRAVKAATEREPWLPRGFVVWVFARLVAMALLVGAAWVVYDCATSDRFQVRSVRVQGNVLMSRAEIQTVSTFSG